MESLLWMGVDVSKATFHVAVAQERLWGDTWRKLPCEEFEHSAEGIRALLQSIKRQELGALDGVCIEATGRLAQRFTQLAKGRLGGISIINPARSAAFKKSLGCPHKNDPIDACLLAFYGQHVRPRVQTPVSAPYTRVREMSRAYQDLQTQYQAQRQRLADGPECKEVRTLLKRLIRTLAREMEALQNKIQALIKATPELQADANRIATVPGLGPRTAQILLAEFADLRQYNRDELVALAGLYPRQHQSGTSVHKAPRITKAGKANVRAVLYMAAMSAKQCNPKIKAFAQRLSDKGKAPMQILVAIMRKLLLIAHAIVVQETNYDPNYQTIQNPS